MWRHHAGPISLCSEFACRNLVTNCGLTPFHFSVVTQHFSLERARDTYICSILYSGIDSSTCNGFGFHVLIHDDLKPATRIYRKRSTRLFWVGTIVSWDSLPTVFLPAGSLRLIYLCCVRNEIGCSVWSKFLTICPKSVSNFMPLRRASCYVKFCVYTVACWSCQICFKARYLLRNEKLLKPLSCQKGFKCCFKCSLLKRSWRWLAFRENFVLVSVCCCLTLSPCCGVQRSFN